MGTATRVFNIKKKSEELIVNQLNCLRLAAKKWVLGHMCQHVCTILSAERMLEDWNAFVLYPAHE